MAIVVNNALRTVLGLDGHPLYLFDGYWYSVSYEQAYSLDYDAYWDEPSAMDIEFSMPYWHLGRWLFLLIFCG